MESNQYSGFVKSILSIISVSIPAAAGRRAGIDIIIISICQHKNSFVCLFSIQYVNNLCLIKTLEIICSPARYWLPSAGTGTGLGYLDEILIRSGKSNLRISAICMSVEKLQGAHNISGPSTRLTARSHVSLVTPAKRHSPPNGSPESVTSRMFYLILKTAFN